MDREDTNLNSENNNTVQVTKKIIQVQTNTNGNNTKFEKSGVSSKLKEMNNLQDANRFKEINNSLESSDTDKGKSFLVTIAAIIGIVGVLYLSFHAVNIAKKVIDYLRPTEVNYVKEMTNKLTKDSNLRILKSGSSYFVIFPKLGKIDTNYIVKLDVYQDALVSKMEAYNYNSELGSFMFYGDDYKTNEQGVEFNGLNYVLDEVTTASIYKYEDENALMFVMLVKLNGRDIAVYFNGANKGKPQNVNAYYIEENDEIKINDDLILKKDKNALILGETKLVKVV